MGVGEPVGVVGSAWPSPVRPLAALKLERTFPRRWGATRVRGVMLLPPAQRLAPVVVMVVPTTQPGSVAMVSLTMELGESTRETLGRMGGVQL